MANIRKCVYLVLFVNYFFLLWHLGVSLNDVRYTEKGNNNNNKTAFHMYRKKEINDFSRARPYIDQNEWKIYGPFHLPTLTR